MPACAVINMALMGYQAVQVVFLVRTVGLDPGLVGLLLDVKGRKQLPADLADQDDLE